jgi:hypothetical protein
MFALCYNGAWRAGQQFQVRSRFAMLMCAARCARVSARGAVDMRRVVRSAVLHGTCCSVTSKVQCMYVAQKKALLDKVSVCLS